MHHDSERRHPWNLALASHHAVPWRRPSTLPHWRTRAKSWALASSPSVITSSIIMPTHVQSTHPYSASGQFDAGGEAQGEYLEQLALLSFLAGITSAAKLLTAVLVLPHRPPVLTAKMLATIDVISQGRGIVGGGGGGGRGRVVG